MFVKANTFLYLLNCYNNEVISKYSKLEMKVKKNIENVCTGWELNFKDNLLLSIDNTYFNILKFYRLSAANQCNTLFAIIRDSDCSFYGKTEEIVSIKLLSVYSNLTWRHFYLPNNRRYLDINILDNKIIIITDKECKMLTFEMLEKVPILFDCSEINRRVFFDSLNNYRGK